MASCMNMAELQFSFRFASSAYKTSRRNKTLCALRELAEVVPRSMLESVRASLAAPQKARSKAIDKAAADAGVLSPSTPGSHPHSAGRGRGCLAVCCFLRHHGSCLGVSGRWRPRLAAHRASQCVPLPRLRRGVTGAKNEKTGLLIHSGLDPRNAAEAIWSPSSNALSVTLHKRF